MIIILVLFSKFLIKRSLGIDDKKQDLLLDVYENELIHLDRILRDKFTIKIKYVYLISEKYSGNMDNICVFGRKNNFKIALSIYFLHKIKNRRITDDELSVILGHEISHVINGDTELFNNIRLFYRYHIFFISAILYLLFALSSHLYFHLYHNIFYTNEFYRLSKAVLLQITLSIICELMVIIIFKRREFMADTMNLLLLGNKIKIIETIKKFEGKNRLINQRIKNLNDNKYIIHGKYSQFPNLTEMLVNVLYISSFILGMNLLFIIVKSDINFALYFIYIIILFVFLCFLNLFKLKYLTRKNLWKSLKRFLTFGIIKEYKNQNNKDILIYYLFNILTIIAFCFIYKSILIPEGFKFSLEVVFIFSLMVTILIYITTAGIFLLIFHFKGETYEKEKSIIMKKDTEACAEA